MVIRHMLVAPGSHSPSHAIQYVSSNMSADLDVAQPTCCEVETRRSHMVTQFWVAEWSLNECLCITVPSLN
jgi:hypothetical protein